MFLFAIRNILFVDESMFHFHPYMYVSLLPLILVISSFCDFDVHESVPVSTVWQAMWECGSFEIAYEDSQEARAKVRFFIEVSET